VRAATAATTEGTFTAEYRAQVNARMDAAKAAPPARRSVYVHGLGEDYGQYVVCSLRLHRGFASALGWGHVPFGTGARDGMRAIDGLACGADVIPRALSLVAAIQRGVGGSPARAALARAAADAAEIEMQAGGVGEQTTSIAPSLSLADFQAMCCTRHRYLTQI
jgi:hypothetical protein